MEQNRKLIGKIEVKGNLECLTGLHIGASKENMEIGALDSPVVRDPLTSEPYIPGSSLKGKLRSLLEKSNTELLPNRNGGTRSHPIMRHECDDWKKGDSHNKDSGALSCPVCRIFGSTGPGEGNKNFPARLKVRDLKLTKESKEALAKMDTGLLYTEWKFENSIDRITSAANPRNLERVPKGATFALSVIYDVEDVETIQADLENLKLAIQLLHDDALGGHGSRGYGQVELKITEIKGKKIDYYKNGEDDQIKIVKLEEIDQIFQFFKNGQANTEG